MSQPVDGRFMGLLTSLELQSKIGMPFPRTPSSTSTRLKISRSANEGRKALLSRRRARRDHSRNSALTVNALQLDEDFDRLIDIVFDVLAAKACASLEHQ